MLNGGWLIGCKGVSSAHNTTHQMGFRHIYSMVVFLFLAVAGQAQDVVFDSLPKGRIDISPHVWLWARNGRKLPADMALPDGMRVPGTHFGALLDSVAPNKLNVFFRFGVVNRTADSMDLLLHVPLADIIEVMVGDERQIGGFQARPDRRPVRYLTSAFAIRLAPGEKKVVQGRLFFFLKYRDNHNLRFTIGERHYMTGRLLGRPVTDVDYKFALFSAAFFAVLVFMFLFMLLQYMQLRDPLYLYYSGYLGGMAVYALSGFEAIGNVAMWLSGDFDYYWVLKHPFGLIVNVLYYYFIREFLDLKHTAPRVKYVYDRFSMVLLFWVIGDLVLGLVMGQYALARQIYLAVRLLWIIPSVAFLFIIWRKSIPYSHIILVGTAILILGSLISLVMSIVLSDIGTFWEIPVVYTMIALVLEIGFFSIAIARRIKDKEQERLYSQKMLIEQLTENERLQSEMNIQLQERVKHQELEKRHQQLELEKEKAEMKNVRLERELAVMELSALRAQMNPHFIFNTLNSIKSYILSKGPLESAEYLTNFSQLIRSILNNASKAQISLKEELATILLYIKLEQKRFPERFDFVFFNRVGDVSLEQLQVPPLILQPFVENAIWHGLLHLEEKGVLQIEVVRHPETGCIQIIIEDSGIGRRRAAELQKSAVRKHKSMGMGITRRRIDLHNLMFNRGITVRIMDLYPDKENTGTRVEISISCPHKGKPKQPEDETTSNSD